MNNRVVRNISWGGRWMDIYDYLDFNKSVSTIKDNLIGDPIVLRRRADGQKGWDPYYLDIDTKEGFIAIRAGRPPLSGRVSREYFRHNTTRPVRPRPADRRDPGRLPCRRRSASNPLRFSEMGLLRP